MRSPPTILQCLEHPQIWRPWLEPDPGTRSAWFAVWRAMFGLPMTEECLKTFTECTGRPAPQPGGHRSVWLICGRRAGKTLFMAITGVYLAAFRQWKGVKGERLVVLLIATTAKQARSLLGYVRSLLLDVPALASMVERETQNEIELNNGVTLLVEVSDFRSIRGSTVVAALVDEAAYLSADGASTDKELLIAIRGAMISTADSILIVGSTPYGRKGVVWEASRDWFGKADAKELVWVAPSLTMNPTLDPQVIERALQDDPFSARAEYLAQFRDDVSAFIPRELIEASVDRDIVVRAQVAGVTYFAFCDPSGGTVGGDAFTVAVAHGGEADGMVVLDALIEKPGPFNPSSVVAEIAALLKSYGLYSTVGDRYSAAWVSESFAAEGITYIASRRDRSAIYSECLPLFTAGRARLLDHDRTVKQFAGLERVAAGSGKDRIDHPRGQHDDAANAVAGALVLAAAKPAEALIVVPYVGTGRAPDKWSADWGDGGYYHTPADYEKDYETGSSSWMRARARGEL